MKGWKEGHSGLHTVKAFAADHRRPLWFAAAVALAAVVLFPGLGSFGLWDPWEMQRAHTARSIAEGARVLVIEVPATAEEGGEAFAPLTRALRDAYPDLAIQGPLDFASERAANRAAAGPLLWKKGLAALDQGIWQAIVIDARLALTDPAKPAEVDRFAREMDAIINSNDGALVVLYRADDAPAEDVLREAYTRGAAREALAMLQKAGVPDPASGLGEAEVTKELSGSPAFTLDVPVVAGADALVAALADVSGSQWGQVQFKRDGEAYSVPVLDQWLVASAYRTFGFSEWSSRLPFALLTFSSIIIVFLLGQALFGARAGLLAALVLTTMPLTFSAGRNLAGQAPYAVLLLVAMGAFLLLLKGAPMLSGLLALALATAMLFLSSGLFGVFTLVVILTAYVLATLDLRSRTLVPLGLVLTLFGVGLLLVFSPAEWSFFEHFKFMQRLHSKGPAAESRNFDYFVRQVGFGAFPWSALLPFALGRMLAGARTFWGTERGEVDAEARAAGRIYALIFLWFSIPLVLHMAMLKDFSQIVLPVGPPIALAIALFLGRLLDGEQLDRFAAFVSAGILLMLLRDIRTSPEPLLSFLAYDPPFTREKGGLVFPTDFKVSGSYLLATAVGMLVLVNHFSRLGSVGLRVARFFRGLRPLGITVFVVLGLLCLYWLMSLLGRFDAAWKMPEAAQIPANQKLFSREVLRRPEHVLGAFAAFGLAAVWLFGVTAWGRRMAERIPRVLRAVGRGVARAYAATRLSDAAVGVVALVGLGAIALVDALVRVQFPEGYEAGSTFADPVVWVLVLGLAAALAIAGTRLADTAREGSWAARLPKGKARWLAPLAIFAALLLYVAVRLSKEAWMTPPELWAILAVATLVGTVLIARLGLSRTWVLGFVIAGAMLAITGSILIPLVQKWRELAPTLFGDQPDDTIQYLFSGSRVVKVLVGVLVLLAVNALWGRRDAIAARVLRLSESNPVRRLIAARLGERALLTLERARVAVPLFVLCAVAITLLTNQKLVPAVSFHVSQKHIIDTWREANEGQGDDTLFKHGAFGTSGDDYNFYTSPIPQVADRSKVLEALLHQQDTPVKLTGASSDGEVRVVQGFSPANDLDGDGKRDWPADAGVADRIEDGVVVDDDKAWRENQWAGFVLVDSGGRQYPITSNTANTLQVQGRPTGGREDSYRNVYAIDSRDARDHGATAMARERSFFLLPKLQFSELNWQFRKVSAGRHIPVLDDRSSRIVLAASFLRDDEQDENWVAKHVTSEEEMADIPGIKRTYVNFEDQIALIGWRMEQDSVRARDDFKVYLYFKALGEISTSYKLFMHIDKAGTSNRIHSDHYVMNQTSDTEEKGCIGCFQTRHWMPGDVVIDEFSREVPLGTPGGPQNIWLGFYNTANDKRLKVKDFDRGRVVHDGGNRVKIGAFNVR